MDRRALFFIAAAAICFVLTPLAEAGQRWVPIAVAVTYIVLAILSALDHWSKQSN